MITADLSGIKNYTAMVGGTLEGIESDLYVNYIMDGMYRTLAVEFNAMFFAKAKSNPRSYHHVFEWGTLADASAPVPLYSIVSTGRGKGRAVAFVFRPSMTNIPEPTPESTGVDQDELDKLSGRRYKFKNKAAVMEYGLSVNINAKHAKKLFIPALGSTKGFTFASSVVVKNPGGDETTGAFTGFWTTWWSGVAPTLVEVQSRNIEKMIKKDAEATGRKLRTGNRKMKSFGLKSNPYYAMGKFAQLASARQYASTFETVNNVI